MRNRRTRFTKSANRNNSFTMTISTSKIVYAYQRLLDEDNAPGIYCTVFYPRITDSYAKHQLMDYAHGKYPFVVSTYERTSKRLYSTRSIPQIAEPDQQALKVEVDSAIDAQSLTTLPPIEHPLEDLQVDSGLVSVCLIVLRVKSVSRILREVQR